MPDKLIAYVDQISVSLYGLCDQEKETGMAGILLLLAERETERTRPFGW